MLIFALLAAAYFAFLALNAYAFKLDWILLGVVGELATLPMIVAVAVAFVCAVPRLLSPAQAVNPRLVSAAVILFVLNCLIWGSLVSRPAGFGHLSPARPPQDNAWSVATANKDLRESSARDAGGRRHGNGLTPWS